MWLHNSRQFFDPRSAVPLASYSHLELMMTMHDRHLSAVLREKGNGRPAISKPHDGKSLVWHYKAGLPFKAYLLALARADEFLQPNGLLLEIQHCQ